MALPTFQAAGTEAAGTTTCTPTWPTHQADDIGLCVVESASTGGAPIDTPSGWAHVGDSPQVANSGAGTTGTRLTVFWKRAAGAAETDPVCTGTTPNHIVAQVLTFRGCITTGDPWDVTAGDFLDTNSTTVTIPGDTTTLADCLVVAAGSSYVDTLIDEFSGWANSDLANVTERADAFTDLANGGGFGVATGEKAAAGAFGATTATLATTSAQARIAVALKPVALAAPTLRTVRSNLRLA